MNCIDYDNWKLKTSDKYYKDTYCPHCGEEELGDFYIIDIGGECCGIKKIDSEIAIKRDFLNLKEEIIYGKVEEENEYYVICKNCESYSDNVYYIKNKYLGCDQCLEISKCFD